MSSYYFLTQIISAICQRIGMLLDGNLVPEKCLDFGFELKETTEILQGRRQLTKEKFQTLIDAGLLNTEQRGKCNIAFFKGKVELTEEEFNSIRKNGHLHLENNNVQKDLSEETKTEEITNTKPDEIVETATDGVIKDNPESPTIETNGDSDIIEEEEKSPEIRLGDLLKKYLKLASSSGRKLHEETGIIWPHLSHLLNSNLYGISDEKARSLIEKISNFLSLSSKDRDTFYQTLEKEIALKKSTPKKRSGRKKKEISIEEISEEETVIEEIQTDKDTALDDEINEEVRLGDLFFKYLKRNDLKQNKIAEMLHFSQYHISHFKQNNFDKISNDTIRDLVDNLIVLFNLSEEEKIKFSEIAEREIAKKNTSSRTRNVRSNKKEAIEDVKETRPEEKANKKVDGNKSCLINVERYPAVKKAIAELFKAIAKEKSPLANEIDGEKLLEEIEDCKAIVLLI